MEKEDLLKLTDKELLEEKKKLKKSKIIHAVFIGFIAGVLIFGVVSWLLAPKKRIGFFIPMLIPIYFLYKLIKKPKTTNDLHEVLKKRNLN
ncbi:hypothetical protein [Polaribacter sp.]|uniref:hypothetical protein n=1 Tax=Polaribacter sp. TaxID=1920175 RepID=UPI003F6BECD1